MRIAFGLLLFALMYGPIAYMVYAALKRTRPASARASRPAPSRVGRALTDAGR
jgi:hypothetical protein